MPKEIAGQGGGAPMEPEEVRKLRRQAAIKQKDDEYQRKRHEEEERKKVELARLKAEAIAEEKQKKAEKVGHLKKQADIRARVKAENERLNARRDEKIKLKQAAWKKRTNVEIQKICNDYIEEENRIDDRRGEARRKREEQIAHAKLMIVERQELEQDRDSHREEKIAELEVARQVRALLRTDDIKAEADAELRSFVQNPFPVPLKQVLAGRVRPVPTVTKLLASYKDSKEELDELQIQDFELRANLRKQSLFKYVHDMQAKADELRVRAPEPMLSDLGRRGGAGKKGGAASPKGKRGGAASPSSTAKTGFGKFGQKNKTG